MSNISKHMPVFSIAFFAITLNCFNVLAHPQVSLEENSSKSLNSQHTNTHQEEIMLTLKEKRKKLKEKLKQAKKDRKKAKSSALLYYAAKTLPFISYAIAPHIAPLITHMFNKYSNPSTKSSYPNSNNHNNNTNNELDLTSHLLCQTIAALFNMYVEKQAINEEFKKGKVKAFEEQLEEEKKIIAINKQRA